MIIHIINILNKENGCKIFYFLCIKIYQYLCNPNFITNARVAELVDALVSKTNESNLVRVRFPPRVLNSVRVRACLPQAGESEHTHAVSQISPAFNTGRQALILTLNFMFDFQKLVVYTKAKDFAFGNIVFLNQNHFDKSINKSR